MKWLIAKGQIRDRKRQRIEIIEIARNTFFLRVDLLGKWKQNSAQTID